MPLKNVLLKIIFPTAICVVPGFLTAVGSPFRSLIVFALFALLYFYLTNFRSFALVCKKKRNLVLQFLLYGLEEKLKKHTKMNFTFRIYQPTRRFSSDIPVSYVLKQRLEEITDINAKANCGVIYLAFKGAPGLCYATGQIITCNLAGMNEEELRSWRLSTDELTLLSGIGSTICIPLKEKKETKAKGCLCIEAKEPIDETPFTEAEFRKVIRRWIKPMSVLL